MEITSTTFRPFLTNSHLSGDPAILRGTKQIYYTTYLDRFLPKKIFEGKPSNANGLDQSKTRVFNEVALSVYRLQLRHCADNHSNDGHSHKRH